MAMNTNPNGASPENNVRKDGRFGSYRSGALGGGYLPESVLLVMKLTPMKLRMKFCPT